MRIVAGLFLLCGPAEAREPVTVFAAASLTDAMEAAGAAYRDKTGRKIRFSFAASSTLARQIVAGAPAHIFASANERWMDELDRRGLLEPSTRATPFANRLVVIAPRNSDIHGVNDIRELDIPAILGTRDFLAVGDPDHVPAGIYARRALEHLGLWQALQTRLARANNVRAALALVARGEAPLGIVYETDARISPGLRIIATFPEESHGPIRYPFAILKGERHGRVERFFDFLTGPEGLAIFATYGFTRPLK